MNSSLGRGRKYWDSLIIGVAFFAPDGQILYVNPSGLLILGVTDKEVVDRGGYLSPAWDLVDANEQPVDRSTLSVAKALATGKPARGMVGVRRDDQSIVWLNVMSSPVYTRKGKLEGVIATYGDITQIINAQKYQEHLQQIRASLLQNLSHELNTPLTAVLGYAELLLDHNFSEVSEKQRAALEAIRKGARDMARRLEQVMTLAEAQGQLDNVFERVVISTIVLQTVADMLVLARRRPTAISVEKAYGTFTVMGNSVMLRRAVFELLDNAIKFVNGGKVAVAVFQEEESVVVSIEDTGIGISKTNLEKIFEPGYQVDSSMTRKYGGMGMGLAVVKDIMKQHGGRIEVQSEIGKGSTFTLYFPA